MAVVPNGYEISLQYLLPPRIGPFRFTVFYSTYEHCSGFASCTRDDRDADHSFMACVTVEPINILSLNALALILGREVIERKPWPGVMSHFVVIPVT